MDKLDVWRTAKILIDAHGPQTAWQHAIILAFEAADLSDLATWPRVVDAIDEITRATPRIGETVH